MNNQIDISIECLYPSQRGAVIWVNRKIPFKRGELVRLMEVIKPVLEASRCRDIEFDLSEPNFPYTTRCSLVHFKWAYARPVVNDLLLRCMLQLYGLAGLQRAFGKVEVIKV